MESEHPGKCLKCGHHHIIKAGRESSGKQRWKCRGCGRCFVANPQQSYDEAFRERVLHALREGMSQRAACRVFGVARMTVAAWLKKSPELARAQNHARRGAGRGRPRAR